MAFIRENLLKIVVFIVVLIVVIVIFALVSGGKKSGKSTTYSTLEQDMINATEKYLNANPKLKPKGEEVSKINLDTLENSKYLSEYNALEDSNVKCSGYIEVSIINDEYDYVPYLKCGKYYETKTIASYIKDKESIVTSGDGLYKIGDTYVFRGENPNNYIKIGDRVYRIIDIKDNELKLISNKKLSEYFTWDDRYNIAKEDNVGINDYSKSRLKEAFDYIIKYNKYNEDEEEKVFSDLELEKMIKHDVCTGKRASTFGDISSANECSQKESNQKLSLITVSDYARASLDPNCKTIFDPSCVNYNYFSIIADVFKTITATSDNSYQIFYIDEGVADLSFAYNQFSPNIVIYIGASSLYSDGDGTLENPYIVR